MRNKFAKVVWSVADLQTLFNINNQQAAEFLDANEGHIQDRMIELGWGVLEDLGRADGLTLTKEP